MTMRHFNITAVVVATVAVLLGAGPAQAEYGIVNFDVQTQAGPEGGYYAQAGGHPYAIKTSIEWNSHQDPNVFGLPRPDGSIKDALVDVPPGVVGNVAALPTCNAAELNGNPPTCPVDSEVGTIALDIEASPLFGGSGLLPLFNMEAPAGLPARFGFDVAGTLIFLDVQLRSDGNYGLTIGPHNTPQALRVFKSVITFWGVPSDHRHDGERCASLEFSALPQCTGPEGTPTGPHASNLKVALLTNPTSCTTPGVGIPWTLNTNSWEDPASVANSTILSHEDPGFPEPFADWGPQRGIENCDVVPFTPGFSAKPTTNQAASPTGLNVEVTVPTGGFDNPSGIAQADLKKAVVRLPEGMTINPSAGTGLGVCSTAQLAGETATSEFGEGCPAESKLGSVSLTSPAISEPLSGSLFLAKPYDNQFNSLLAIYLVLKNPDRGLLVKLSGKIEPNPTTGQLVTTFDENPQLPFERFTLQFRQGARSPLVTPPSCGTYYAEAEFSPWSDPDRMVTVKSPFQVTEGIGGGACPAGGIPAFKPQVVSGTQNNDAGSYSQFYLRILREDGEQEITKFTTVLPSGLAANLTGVPFCPDVAIQAAREASGQHELQTPSCPAASEVGHTLVGAGVGTVLAWAPGKVYLAGPYHGSALSIVSVTSATVGPFDLGTVVIRFALRINPLTGQAEIDSTGSDPIPHVIDGIVVHVRDIHVYVDRSQFMVNPTSCDPLSISNTITGAGADPSNLADQTPITVTTPFQAADCLNLGFKPLFKGLTSGRTSRTNGASLHVALSYPKEAFGKDANIKSVKVDLPKQLPSRLTTLQKACLYSLFNANPAACPAASRVGTAKAITPILPVPLEGPAYFVSHGGAKFPELIVVLQGYGITIDLHGETFINKAGITSSTFRSVPDEPVTSFELTLPQGPNSALAANGNLCALTKSVLVKRKVTVRSRGHSKTVTRQVRTTLPPSLTMPTAFTAQNGVVIKQNTAIAVTGCPKKKAQASSHRRHDHEGVK
jgi:hypothetical protein